MSYLKAQNRRVTKLPSYGHSFQNGYIVPNPQEQEVVSKILHYASLEKSLCGIVSKLTNEGVLSRTGKPFHAQTIKRIITQGSLCAAIEK